MLLSGLKSKGYLDGEQIVESAKSHEADVIIPGHRFLSENAEFARQAAAAGMVFAVPTAENIYAFGMKHTARELAVKAGVPIGMMKL